jgi:hypothetical protein
MAPESKRPGLANTEQGMEQNNVLSYGTRIDLARGIGELHGGEGHTS